MQIMLCVPKMMFFHLCAILCFPRIANGCGLEQRIKIPKVELIVPLGDASFDGNGDIDFQNETTLIMSNSYPRVNMICKASYPIQWTIHYHKDDDGNIIKHAFVQRRVSNFLNVASYEYEATLRYDYQGKVFTPSNFSCHSTKQEEKSCMETSVVTTLPKNNPQYRNVIIFTIHPGLHLTTLKEKENINCESRVVYYNITRGEGYTRRPFPCFRCYQNLLNGTDIDVDVDFVKCNTAMHCNIMFGAINRGSKCLKIEPVKMTNEYRKIFYTSRCNTAQDTSQAVGRFITCKYFGLRLALNFAHSLPDRGGNIETYFNWYDIDPQKMLAIDISSSSVFIHENITVSCRFSSYYFSFGSKIAFELSNGSLIFSDAVDKEDISTDNLILETEINVNILTIQKVVCFGAVWNSTEWVKTSAPLYVDDNPIEPYTAERSENKEINIFIGDINQTIECKGEGRPLPKLRWTETPVLNPEVYYNESEGLSVLLLREVSNVHAGMYKCEAKNYVGEFTQTFHVSVYDSKKKNLAIIITVLVLVVTSFAVVAFILWRRIKSQSEIIRNLTEDEISEFLLGSKNHKFVEDNNYHNKPEVIDAMPFDKIYEYPKGNIKIDEVNLLGEGAYGQVYKGLFKSDSTGTTFDEIVAVKTVKPTVSVDFFKTILSEIKILAYLGKHENIVSLIAACTENIKIREVYVVLEFCERGDLQQFLSKNRINYTSSFVDYSNITEDYPLTTKDLLKWTVDVANGLDYLQQKRVIHGDLAARNILLDKSYTAKISDFGLSRQLLEFSNYVKTTKMPLPFKWLALESLKFMEFSTLSDVWAFGVTMWEIFSLGEVPYAGCNYSVEFTQQLEGGMRLGKPKECADDIYVVMLHCWDPVPADRPQYSEIKSLCAKYLHKLSSSNGC